MVRGLRRSSTATDSFPSLRKDPTAGIELPTVLYLAKRNHGAIGVAALSDERTGVRVQLPVEESIKYRGVQR